MPTDLWPLQWTTKSFFPNTRQATVDLGHRVVEVIDWGNERYSIHDMEGRKVIAEDRLTLLAMINHLQSGEELSWSDPVSNSDLGYSPNTPS